MASGSAERARECRKRKKEREPYWKALKPPYQIGRDEFTYKDIKKDEDGWVDAEIYRPFPYDLVTLDNGIKSIIGWWTGIQWDGLRLKEEHKIRFWKIYEESEEEKN